MNKIDFEHRMAAHCETGTLSAQLKHAGLELSEPMIFGIGSGIFFGYFNSPRFPFPHFIVRNKPGQIRKNISKRLNIRFKEMSYGRQSDAMRETDALLEKGIPPAAQVDFFYMEYLPQHLRVHINVHFVTITGKDEQGNYLISDCYHPRVMPLSQEALWKGRFAGGNLAPKGFMFYPLSVPTDFDYPKAISKGIKKACFNMLKIPIPFLGIKGMRKFAAHLPAWPGLAMDNEHLSHEVTKINVLLEDQGTGGAGFRFMYATFLKQSAAILNDRRLDEMSKRMMDIGDNWREVSLYAARIGKNRDFGSDKMRELGAMIFKQADAEEAFFKDLARMF